MHALFLTMALLSPAATEKLAVFPTQFEPSAKGKVPRLIDEYLLTAVQELGRYEVIGKDDIEALLGFEKQKEMLGCDDTSCLADIGGALGVDRLLTMKVALVGNEWATNVKVINTKDMKVELRSSEFVKGSAADLLKAVPGIIHKLFSGGGSASASTNGGVVAGPMAGAGSPSAATLSALAQMVEAGGPKKESLEKVWALFETYLKQRVAERRLDGRNPASVAAKCSGRNSGACKDAGAMYMLGVGGPVDRQRALETFAMACDSFSFDACVETAAAGMASLHLGAKQQAVFAAVDPACALAEYSPACGLMVEYGAEGQIAGKMMRHGLIFTGIGGVVGIIAIISWRALLGTASEDISVKTILTAALSSGIGGGFLLGGLIVVIAAKSKRSAGSASGNQFLQSGRRVSLEPDIVPLTLMAQARDGRSVMAPGVGLVWTF